LANYYGFTRTNYFAVKDEERFRQVVASCQASEENPEVWEEAVDGQTLFAFGCYGSLSGLPCGDEEDYECDLGAFHNALQQVVADGHAIIITEVGYEKLRYLVGDCTVITSQEIAYTNLSDIGLAKARQLLKNPQYNPVMEY
jgi:hypothetical protein